MAADFSITGEVKLNSDPAEKATSKWTVAAGQLIADFAKKAASSLKSVVKSGLDYNAQMESYLTNFKVMLGNEQLAAEKLEEIRRMAASTPFSLSDLTEGTQTLLQFGIAADDTTGVLKQLGDISLGNADKLQTLVRAYGKMSSAQKVTLENVNMMIDAGFNPLNQICDATGESMSALYKRISDGKVSFNELEAAVAAAADGSTDLTVSAGQAWMHVSRWVGLSVTMREAQTLTLPLADSALPRIDRVVLRHDATSRSTSLQVLQGTPSSEPAAPAISRTEMVYDLCLAEVSRPAGQTSVSAADLTDTRADEALCGLMRDGVTGIPMDELGAQALAKAKETAKLCDKLLASYSGGYLGIWPVTLPADGWESCEDMPGYAYKQTAALRAARAATVPSAVPTPETFTVAVAAGLAGVCETKDGNITFWAENVPEGGIQMQVELLGPSASTADTGEDTLGDTVLEDTTL